MNVGLFFCMLFLQALTDSSSLEPSVSMKASFRSLCRVKKLTWWACLVRVRCVAFIYESAVPEDATSACVRAAVQPEPSNTSPSVFQSAISVCKPPSIITCTFSPWVSGHFHCTNFAKANRSWSNVVSGICHGLRHWIACLSTSMPCLNLY